MRRNGRGQLHRLGVAMQTNHHIFMREGSCRPGNILDHVLGEALAAKSVDRNRLSLRVLWKSVSATIATTPTRTKNKQTKRVGRAGAPGWRGWHY
eukprot:COSAG01_NODE_3226_length_6384_cov_10.417979_3_plen_95_part_00